MLDTEVSKAAKIIHGGGTLIYPTDTIWGLGCNATCEQAVGNVFRIKRRPDRKSMLVLVSDEAMLSRYVKNIHPKALELLRKDRKPTTIIYPGAQNLPGNLLAEDGSIGIRLCRDPFCRMLMEQCDIPLISTSANLSGETAPGSFQDINPILLEEVDHVVGWRQEEKDASVASTIIKMEKNGSMTVLRP